MENQNTSGDGDAWATRAPELARWALERFFVRTDRYGGYKWGREENAVVSRTFPLKGAAAGSVTLALLEMHFRARDYYDVVGAHTIAPGTSGGKWCAIDVDNHADVEELPELNRKYAEARYAELAALGFRPLAADYGGGSVHVVVLFDRAVPGATLKRFAEWFRGDETHEVFPKQAEVAGNQYGNWLRLVGRHKTRPVWAKVYDGANWLEGAAAVAHVLSLVGDTPDLIPEHIRFPPTAPQPAPRPSPPKRPAGTGGTSCGESVFSVYNRTATLAEMTEHCEAAGHKLVSRSSDRATFTRAGKKGGESFNLKAMNGTVFLKNFSCNSGLPEGKGLNPSHARCALVFGTVTEDGLRKLAPILEAELGIVPAGRVANTLSRSEGIRTVGSTDGAAQQPDTVSGVDGNPPGEGDDPPQDDSGERPEWWQPPGDGETWTDPHRVARLFVNATRTPDGAPTLVQWRDEFFRWREGAYRRMGDGDLDAALARHAREVFLADLPARRAEAAEQENAKPVKLVPVTGRVRSDVRVNLGGLVNVPDEGRDAPFWLSGDTSTDPRAVVAAPNGLFTLDRIARGEGPFAPPPPDLFTPNALPFAVPLGECDTPTVWLEKVNEWFNGDTRSVLGLQEWFGYLLSADTAQHKILMLVGPPRSGKGTILRVLSQLVGAANAAATSFAAMAESFGLQDLIGKRVAVIPDARLSGRTDAAAVTERLLGVSGDDPQTVNRKNLPRVTTRLNVRFVVATNEIPKLADASGALASRFHILALPNSFLGREDKGLDGKLAAELPAVLQWAAKGYVRLRTQGAFTQNDAAAHHHKQLEEQSSPVGAFVRECCRVGPTEQVRFSELYSAWCDWCDNRAVLAGAENVLSRDLRTAFPHVVVAQPRIDGKRARWFKGVGLRPRDDWGEGAVCETSTHAA